MVELDENGKVTWGTAHFAGHSVIHSLHNISAADRVTLAHYNLSHVQQLFARNDLTRNIDVNQNATYPEQPQLNHSWLL